jgi:hypothetical protein
MIRISSIPSQYMLSLLMLVSPFIFIVGGSICKAESSDRQISANIETGLAYCRAEKIDQIVIAARFEKMRMF